MFSYPPANPSEPLESSPKKWISTSTFRLSGRPIKPGRFILRLEANGLRPRSTLISWNQSWAYVPTHTP